MQIMHKLALWATPNLDLMLMIFFNIKYLIYYKTELLVTMAD